MVVNLAQLEAKFGEGEEVSLESLESKGVLNLSGRETRLPLKVRAAWACWGGAALESLMGAAVLSWECRGAEGAAGQRGQRGRSSLAGHRAVGGCHLQARQQRAWLRAAFRCNAMPKHTCSSGGALRCSTPCCLPATPRCWSLTPLPPHSPSPQVLGTGELSKKLVIKAAAFSESAKQKIEAAGGTAEELPQKPKWTRALAAAKAAAN